MNERTNERSLKICILNNNHEAVYMLLSGSLVLVVDVRMEPDPFSLCLQFFSPMENEMCPMNRADRGRERHIV